MRKCVGIIFTNLSVYQQQCRGIVHASTDTWKFHFTLQLVIIKHKLLSFSTVVLVEFDPRSYAVNESSGSVSVCVRVNGQLARNVVVRVQTGDISATGS